MTETLDLLNKKLSTNPRNAQDCYVKYVSFFKKKNPNRINNLIHRSFHTILKSSNTSVNALFSQYTVITKLYQKQKPKVVLN